MMDKRLTASLQRRVRIGVLSGCGLLVLALGSAAACGQNANELPAESRLPGVETTSPQQLPGEDRLPGQADSKRESIPGEDQLPGRPGAAAAVQGANADAFQPLGPSPPILRLAYDGHVGTVRTLHISDGGRTLVTGGEDKELHVWRRTDVGATGWLHRRTVRWPVTRGPRGRIYAARLKGDLVAFAGQGAFGSLGEIRIVDVASGDLERVLVDEQEGHQQVVPAVAWSPESPLRLASVDVEGRLIIWAADETTGLWRPRTLVPIDSTTYGEATAKALQSYQRRGFVPVTFLGSNHVIVPRFVGQTQQTNPQGYVNWHLQRIDLRQPDQLSLLSEREHAVHVRSLSSTDDGRVLVSCDHGDPSGGLIGVWKFADDGSVQRFTEFKPEGPPIFVSLDAQGNRLLVGTESRDQLPPTIQIWDLQGDQAKLLSKRELRDYPLAGIIDSAHREVIVSQGNAVEIFPFDDAGNLGAPKRLTVPVKPIQKVAFSGEPGSYRIAIGWNRDAQGSVQLDSVFDLSESKLLGRGPIDPSDYLPSQRTATRWQIGFEAEQTARLYEGDQARGTLPLRENRHGEPTTISTLPMPPTGTQEAGERPATGAVLVGTAGQSNIYVYRASEADPPELLRQFRDHSGAITSISTSADGNYLVSSSADATISVWNLQDIFSATPLINRWGAEFEVTGNRLLTTEVREDGPLYFRGVRSGDRLVSIEWRDELGESFAEADPAQMLQRLLDLPFDVMPTLTFSRLGRPGPAFQSYPAWRPLATLFIDQEREWAFWTPSGYYDASFNGHQRFGWQINHRNVDRAVEYFRAAQFRKQLERPDIMRRLLAAGSLPAAMRQTVSQVGPPPAESAIVNQIESKPTIQLISPKGGEVVDGKTLVAEARISVPRGAHLVTPKAFVSGVPAVSVVQTAEDGESSRFRWTFRVPRDPVLRLEIVAATETEATDRVQINLEHRTDGSPAQKARLHLIAIGVGSYQDPQIQSLDFAVDATEQVVQLFQSHSKEIYHTSADRLIDNDATRPLWKILTQTAADQLAETVSPDDLVIMYLYGHGVRDRRTDHWYFVTSDAKFRDLMHDQYSDCISFSDLASLAKLPCRKLAILDSCHSGAVQPVMRRDDLKSVLRYLQDDVILTLTASEGDEEAVEQRPRGMGLFTSVLAEALMGKAAEFDSDASTVSLKEVVEHVTRRVAEESESQGFSQHPTASPAYLLETLTLPLTSRSASP